MDLAEEESWNKGCGICTHLDIIIVQSMIWNIVEDKEASLYVHVHICICKIDLYMFIREYIHIHIYTQICLSRVISHSDPFTILNSKIFKYMFGFEEEMF